MARLPSLLAGTATIPLVFLVGDRTVGRRAGLVAAALVALSPFMIYYSAEARGYQVMILWRSSPRWSLLLVRRGTLAALVGPLRASPPRGRCTRITPPRSGCSAGLGWLFWARPDLRRDALLANVGAAVLFLPWVSGVLADFDSPTTKILSALEPFTLDFVSTALAHWAIGFPYSVLARPAAGDARPRPDHRRPVVAAVGVWLRFRDGLPQVNQGLVLVAAARPLGAASARRSSARFQQTSSARAISPSPGPASRSLPRRLSPPAAPALDRADRPCCSVPSRSPP